jgi:uncharacterized protein (TIGR03067 family)
MGAAVAGIVVLGSLVATGQEPAPAATAGPKVLKIEELKTIVENLGYEPEADLLDGKINLLYVQWKQGTFQFVLYLSISADGNDMIVQSPLKRLPQEEDAYGKELATILSKGYYLTPSHFVADDTRMLRLIRFVPNRDLTPAKVRKALADFTDQVRNSESVWRCDRWEVKPTALAKPIISPLDGTWRVISLNANGTAAARAEVEGQKITLTIQNGKLTYAHNGNPAAPMAFRVDEKEQTFDIVHPENKVEKGRYVREGKILRLAFGSPDAERPADFTGKAGVTVVELEPAESK